MEKQMPTQSTLRVAGNFASIHRQIGVAVDGHLAVDDLGKRCGVALHDVPVCAMNGFERPRPGDSKDQRVVQAARPLDHCTSPTAAAEYRNPS